MTQNAHPAAVASVVIPSKNRKDMLCDTIRSVLGQTAPVEVLVMDDGSTDGTREKVMEEFPPERFPQVRFFFHDESKGPTERRNEGARLATAEFLFTIDDDCLVPSANTFQQAIDAFDDSRIGAVTLPFINVKQNPATLFAAPDRLGRYVSFMFFGGMVAFRREVYLAMGGYRTFYFMHVEEPDLSVRLLDHGYVTRLGWSDPIHHLESPSRNRKKLHALGPRNFLLYEWYNTPMPALFGRLPVVAGATFLHTVKIGYPHLGVLGLIRGVGGMIHERKLRRPVRPEIFRLSRMLRKGPVRLEEIEGILPVLDTKMT